MIYQTAGRWAWTTNTRNGPDVRYFNETPFSDRHRVAAGFEFLPNKMSKSYFKRISYRAGLNYCNSYFKVNEKDFNQADSVQV